MRYVHDKTRELGKQKKQIKWIFFSIWTGTGNNAQGAEENRCHLIKKLNMKLNIHLKAIKIKIHRKKLNCISRT